MALCNDCGLRAEGRPMLSTTCKTVQICTDPDRFSRICQKLTSDKYGFKIETS